MQVTLPGGQPAEIPDDWTPEQRAQAVRNYVSGPDFDKLVDKTTGAPATVRLAVGGGPEKDRLSNLKRFYPDAIPYGQDNFVFTDPDSGRPTLYNPKGFDAGDIASLAREGAQTVGGTLGAAAGALAGVAGGPLAPLTVPGAAAVGAGMGTAAAGSLFDIAGTIAGAISGRGRTDTRGPVEHLTDTAVDFAGGAVGQRVGDLLSIGARSVFGGGNAGRVARMADFQGAGVEPPAGAVSGSKPVQAVESALGNSPGSAARMQQQNERIVSQVQTEANRIAGEFGDVRTPQGAGETIREGAQNAAERFNARQEEIYNAAFSLVGPDAPVTVPNVTKLRTELEAKLAQAPESRGRVLQPAIDRLKEIEQDAAGSGIPFQALREIRTDMGREIKDPLLAGSSGAQNEFLKQAYAALTQDMSAAAKTSGPEAEKALNVADRYTRRIMQERMPLLQKIADLDADEKAFSLAMSASQEGGTKLQQLRQSFTRDEWNTVAATVVGRMGLAKAGAQDATGEAFSVNTFLTNWSKLSPEAKEALFGGSRYADLRPQLDRLVRVVGALKEAGKAENPSGTARHLAALGTVSALGGALGLLAGGDSQSAALGIAGAIVAPNVAARLITSPRFVQWLVDAGRVASNPNGFAQHMGRLLAIAKAEPEIKEEIGQYVSALRGVPSAAGNTGQ